MLRSLGFGPIPEPVFIYVSQESKQVCWYRIVDYNTMAHIPIAEPALTGFVTGLRLKAVDQGKKFGLKVKLDLFVSADRRYVIRSTHTTAFVRGLMLGLLAVPDITQPVTIAVRPGDQGKTVLVSVYDHHDQEARVDYQAEKDNPTPIDDLILAVARLFDQQVVEVEPATAVTTQPSQDSGGATFTDEEERLKVQTEFILDLAIEKGLVKVDGDLRMTDALAKDCWDRYQCSYLRLPRDKAREYVDLLRAM